MVMPYILDTSCSRKSLSSTVEQQDDADGGKDGVISGDTSITPYPPSVQTREDTWRNQTQKPTLPIMVRNKSLYFFQ
jgi:hypothetical protein